MTSGNAPPEGYSGGAFPGHVPGIVQILSQLVVELDRSTGHPADDGGRVWTAVNGLRGQLPRAARHQSGRHPIPYPALGGTAWAGARLVAYLQDVTLSGAQCLYPSNPCVRR